MSRQCRDCPICTEPFIVSFLYLPFRIVKELALFWNIRLFQRKCPQCRHLLKIHHRIGGRFVD